LHGGNFVLYFNVGLYPIKNYIYIIHRAVIFLDSFEVFVKIPGKYIPLQACTGSQGYRRLRLPEFQTIGT
jgi:hypothetical protein